MPHPIGFRSQAYRALIRALGESDAAVEWIEVGVREIQRVNEIKGANAAKKLAVSHGVFVNPIDLVDLRNRCARLQILAVYQQIEYFLRSFRKTHPRQVEYSRNADEGALTATLAAFNIKSDQVGKLEVDLFRYYRVVRNLIMHDPKGNQSKTHKRTCDDLQARVKTSPYSTLDAPNPIGELCFDDFVLFTRIIEGHSIDISLGGVHNVVVGSDIDQHDQVPIDLDDFSAIIADGTGIKQQKGKKGELRAVIGVTTDGNVEPLGTFANTKWDRIERVIKERIKHTKASGIPFIYDGEPGLDNFLAEVTETQRCTWHGPRGLYHSLWEDGLKKKDSQPQIDKLKHLIGIELPQTDYELLKKEDKQTVQKQYESSKAEIKDLINIFKEKGYHHGAEYLENLTQRLFTHVEIWLRTGVIAPKTTSLLERIFREIGRRIKRIAWGWSDSAVSKLSKMIILKKYSKEKWEQYWKSKLGIEGNFSIQVSQVEICPCPHF